MWKRTKTLNIKGKITMEKLVYFISYLGSLLNFFGAKEPLEYRILTQEEMSKNTDVKYVSSFQDDAFETVGSGATARTMTVKKTKFLVSINKRDWVLKLKKHLLIGKKNFKEFDAKSDENAILQNRIESLNTKIQTISEEKIIHEDYLMRLERLIGGPKYLEYKNEVNRIIEREKAEKRS
jgi:hypothetical protein